MHVFYLFAFDVSKLAADNVKNIVEIVSKQTNNKILAVLATDARLKEYFKETKMHYQETVRAIYMYILIKRTSKI